MTYVEVEKISFRYARRQPRIIDKLSFTMRKGEIVGILGPSGSGKSTLLRLVAGLEVPEEGSIAIEGRIIVDERTCLDAEKRGVGMVFQDYALFPHLNTADNIAFGLHKLKRADRNQRLREMLELVQLTDYAQRYPHELSGGQQQRVALARALAPQPSILLMDEPFSNLDANLKSSIRSELRQILSKAGMTCLFVSHDQADIEAICDRSISIV
ncbi:ABC transporter ATP-binding protein [Paenibacillus sp. J2TS4]|uniref:ABC transporter ATP-binding protein n=1 Tax=Paenibacillus sp. J2TS4 TaxID=2807194 RepID=UPI001B0B0840|nr:ABC transporter ATP-binding protein [Paenibacillus sp. J2TS4]GIP34781.1 hypothetical protein J2TS4_39910 [Paenibacillus sp. J2TS4]